MSKFLNVIQKHVITFVLSYCKQIQYKPVINNSKFQICSFEKQSKIYQDPR